MRLPRSCGIHQRETVRILQGGKVQVDIQLRPVQMEAVEQFEAL